MHRTGRGTLVVPGPKGIAGGEGWRPPPAKARHARHTESKGDASTDRWRKDHLHSHGREGDAGYGRLQAKGRGFAAPKPTGSHVQLTER